MPSLEKNEPSADRPLSTPAMQCDEIKCYMLNYNLKGLTLPENHIRKLANNDFQNVLIHTE
ncbi:hypothetical protein T01_7251 [Trichinella spiralis]|uniref:Uncharacterized protein n=1 Tax=Trichinella spiralis TaxID=6334 RepID=A0A0V1BSC0_TRISP|nr:hypothetical protein T01_7251 [Trichinella spiralis]